MKTWRNQLYADNTIVIKILGDDPKQRTEVANEIWSRLTRLGYGGSLSDGTKCSSSSGHVDHSKLPPLHIETDVFPKED